MVALQPPVCNFGWKAQDFNLKGIDDKLHSLSAVKGEKGLLVMFICNHCPFVRAIVDKLVADCQELQKLGLGVVAINANDPVNYPEDSFEKMKVFAREHSFTFPYLVDDTQDVAKAYDAICTPDFFGFNSKLELQYRGRFDESGMQQLTHSKHELLEAMQEIAQKGLFKGEQHASIGCSIKWKTNK